MIKVIIGKILYKTIGCVLPESASRFGKNLGKSFRRMCGKLMFDSIGENVNIDKNSCFSVRISIGDNSGIGKNCYIGGKTIIGKNVMMAPNVKIYSINHKTDRTDIPMCQQGFQEERPVVIGDDVWICDSVIICPGTQIGNGVILGAGAVVRGIIPDNAVVVGNPGQVIKYRGC